MPEAIVALGEAKRIVGTLRFETDGQRQYSQLEYAPEWLKAKDRFSLSPSLPLRTGCFFASTRTGRHAALSGCFSDAAPDSWGRKLMVRALGGGLSEYEHLVFCDDETRQGALRFLGPDMEPLSQLNPQIPKPTELKKIQTLVAQFENNPEVGKEEGLVLAGIAGSLGGARPKTSVQGEGALWIAKFTSEQDTRPVERTEIATLKLAAQCGLKVAEGRLELRESECPVALIRRFDRRDMARIPYISVRTALELEVDEDSYYTDIADVIRQISNAPKEDLKELWSRIVFTILVSNTDDHLKNHGFIYAGNDRWRLSPAFDINPMPTRHRLLKTGILQGCSFDASLDLAMEAAIFFDLEHEQAAKIVKNIAQITTQHWRQMLRSQGVSAAEQNLYRDAFEHNEAEKALRLV